MRTFAVLLPAFIAGALAAPAPQTADPSDPCQPWGCETVEVSGFNLWRDTTTAEVSSVDFSFVGSLNPGRTITCTKTNPVIGQDVVRCSGTNYSFALRKGSDENSPYALRFFHQLGVGIGLTGTGDVPAICRNGGDGRTLCTVASATITLDSVPESD